MVIIHFEKVCVRVGAGVGAREELVKNTHKVTAALGLCPSSAVDSSLLSIPGGSRCKVKWLVPAIHVGHFTVRSELLALAIESTRGVRQQPGPHLSFSQI